MDISGRKTYLSRDGQVYGPFSDEQLNELRTSGQIHSYFWIWDGSADAWSPLHSPPPLPGTLIDDGEAVYEQLDPGVQFSGSGNPLLVICHDFRELMRCKIRSVSKSECVLISPRPKRGLPPFTRGHRVCLSLLDEQSGKTENVVGVVTSAGGGNIPGSWEYVVQWDRIPDLVRPS